MLLITFFLNYWYVDNTQCGEVKEVNTVATPCNIANALGCWKVSEGVIEVKEGLSEEDRVCVIQHERKHAACYNHDKRQTFRIDCGENT